MTINIAIIGGGIAGLCLARGLSKSPNQNLTLSVYEATSEYLDIGDGLAFHGNAMRALALIDSELQAEYFRRATLSTLIGPCHAPQSSVSGVPGSQKCSHDMNRVEGEDGRPLLLAELGKTRGRKTVARCDLLEGFLSLVPGGVLKIGKRLEKIEEDERGISMTFKDGSVERADVVIGCDGVHSVVRKYLLGADHPAVEPKCHDSWEWIGRNVPAEEVKELNPDLLTYVPILCGHGGYMNAIPTHLGKTLNVTVVQSSKQFKLADGTTNGNLEEDKTEQFAEKDFAHWTKDARDILTLALRNPTFDWRLADHDHAPFYPRGNICMIGDAAHATMPFNGQGAAQSIEDAAMLTALFEHVTELGDVEKAFAVYDEMRRPRTQKVVELSRAFGRMYAFADEEVGDDLNEMRRRLGEGGKYTNEVDLEGMNGDAVRRFLGKQG
ncbi:FAD/NAD(P)-binding domain-containing protein [Cadophora sp. DSE1049]|nr:FAD/NAD(P)-binding domain-containing protein [Cadophora sp. DSE1049]